MIRGLIMEIVVKRLQFMVEISKRTSMAGEIDLLAVEQRFGYAW